MLLENKMYNNLVYKLFMTNHTSQNKSETRTLGGDFEKKVPLKIYFLKYNNTSHPSTRSKTLPQYLVCYILDEIFKRGII